MSDISGSDDSIRINAVVTDNATSATAIIANELNNLSNSIASLGNKQISLNNATAALNKTLGLTSSGVNNASKVTLSLSKNNNLLSASIDQARKSLQLLNSEYSNLNKAAGGSLAFNQAFTQTTGHLNSAISSQKSFSRLIRGNELISYGNKITAVGTAAQQSGYLFTRNFSAPIIMGLREVFFQFSKLETENVRITKLLNDNFSSTIDANGKFVSSQTQARAAVDRLGKSLDTITSKWGVSRVLVQAIAGDFAELGIGISDSSVASEQMLYNLTSMTAEMEKLGNLDITASQEFISSMYQNILAVRRELGRSVQVNDAQVAAEIGAELRGQMAMFNIVENKTVMSLRNIAEAFPEVSAAATMFGLNMTEAIAMVVPMIATGFQVGASANSVKVSLQRMVAQTKQNTQIIAGLNQELGPNFSYAAGIGIKNINDLTNSFIALNEAKGKQGVLELASRMFGVRQGPRMATTILQQGQFQQSLQGPGKDRSKGYSTGVVSEEYKIAQALQKNINLRLKAAGLEEITVGSIEDIGMLHRGANEQVSATNSNLTVRARLIKQGQIDAQAELQNAAKANGQNIDFISQTGTEYSKVMLAMAFDTKTYAGSITDMELELSRNTPKVRYDSLKASIIAMGVAIVPIVDDVVKFVLPVFQKFAKTLQDMPTYVKKAIGGFMLLMAISGPLKIALGTKNVLFGGLLGILGRLTLGFGKAKVSAVSLMDVINNPNLLKGAKALVQLPGSQGFLVQGSSRASRLPFGLGRKRPLDLSGVDQASLDVFKQSGVLPDEKRSTLASPLGTAKKFLRERKEQAPGTSALLKALMSTEDTKAKAATEASKKITDSVSKSSAKGAKALADGTKGALAKVAKTIGSIFQNNTFVGNTFTGGSGNSYGPGSKKVGPSGPSSGGTSPRGPPIPVFDGSGITPTGPASTIPTAPAIDGPALPAAGPVSKFNPTGRPLGMTFPMHQSLDELIENRNRILKQLAAPGLEPGFANMQRATLKSINDLIDAKNKLASIPTPGIPKAPLMLGTGRRARITQQMRDQGLPAIPPVGPFAMPPAPFTGPSFAEGTRGFANILANQKKDLVDITGKEIAGFYSAFGRSLPEELKDIANLAGGKAFKIPAPTKASIIKNIEAGGNLVSKSIVGKGKKATEQIIALGAKQNVLGKVGVPTGIFDIVDGKINESRELFANITSQMFPEQQLQELMDIFDEGAEGLKLPVTNVKNPLDINRVKRGNLTIKEAEDIANARSFKDPVYMAADQGAELTSMRAELGAAETKLKSGLRIEQTPDQLAELRNNLSIKEEQLNRIRMDAVDRQMNIIRHSQENLGLPGISGAEGYGLASSRAKNDPSVTKIDRDIKDLRKLPGSGTNQDIQKKIADAITAKDKALTLALDKHKLQIVKDHGFSSIDEIRPISSKSLIPGDTEIPREIKYSYVEPGTTSFDGKPLTKAQNKKRLLEEERKAHLSKLTGQKGQPRTRLQPFPKTALQTEEMFQERANLLKSEGLPTGLKDGTAFRKDGSYKKKEILNQKELDNFQKRVSSRRGTAFKEYMSKYKISETELDKLIAQTNADALAATAARKNAIEAARKAEDAAEDALFAAEEEAAGMSKREVDKSKTKPKKVFGLTPWQEEQKKVQKAIDDAEKEAERAARKAQDEIDDAAKEEYLRGRPERRAKITQQMRDQRLREGQGLPDSLKPVKQRIIPIEQQVKIAEARKRAAEARKNAADLRRRQRLRRPLFPGLVSTQPGAGGMVPYFSQLDSKLANPTLEGKIINPVPKSSIIESISQQKTRLKNEISKAKQAINTLAFKVMSAKGLQTTQALTEKQLKELLINQQKLKNAQTRLGNLKKKLASIAPEITQSVSSSVPQTGVRVPTSEADRLSSPLTADEKLVGRRSVTQEHLDEYLKTTGDAATTREQEIRQRTVGQNKLRGDDLARSQQNLDKLIAADKSIKAQVETTAKTMQENINAYDKALSEAKAKTAPTKPVKAGKTTTGRAVRPRKPNIAYMVPAGQPLPASGGGIPGFLTGGGGMPNPVTAMATTTKLQVTTYKDLMLRAINDFEASAPVNAKKEVQAIATMMRSSLTDVPGAMSGLLGNIVPAAQVEEVMKSLKLELDGVKKATNASLNNMKKGAAYRFENIRNLFATDKTSKGSLFKLDKDATKGIDQLRTATNAGNITKQAAAAKSAAPYALADVYAKSVRNLGYNATDVAGEVAPGIAEMNVGTTNTKAAKYRVKALTNLKNNLTGAKYTLEELVSEGKITQAAADLFTSDISALPVSVQSLGEAANGVVEVVDDAANKVAEEVGKVDNAVKSVGESVVVPEPEKPIVPPVIPADIPKPTADVPVVSGAIPVNTEIEQLDDKILKLKAKIAKNEEKLLNILPINKAQLITLEEAKILNFTEQKAAALAEGKGSKASLIQKQIVEANKRLKALNTEKEALEKATRDLIKKDNNTLKDLNTARTKALKAAEKAAVDPVVGTAGKGATGKGAAAKTVGATAAADVVTAGAAAGAVAGSADGSVVSTLIHTLDEFELEIDSTLANIFKGPNMFVGPNKFINNDFINAKSVKIKDLAKGRTGSDVPDSGKPSFRKVKVGPGGVVDDAASSVDDVAKAVKSPLATIKEKDRLEKLSLGRKKLPMIDGHTPRADGPINKDLLARLAVFKKARDAAAAAAVADPITPAIKSISRKIIDGGNKIGSSLSKASKSIAKAALSIGQKGLSSAGKSGKGVLKSIIDNQGLVKPKNVYQGIDILKQAKASAAASPLGAINSGLIKGLSISIKAMGDASAQTAKIMKSQLLLSIKEINSAMSNSKIIKLWTTMLFTGTNKIIPALRKAALAMGGFDIASRKAAVSAALVAKESAKGSALSFGSKMLTGLNAFTGASGLAAAGINGIRGAFVSLVVSFAKFNALIMLTAPILLLIVGIFSTIKSSGAKTGVAMDKLKQAFASIKDAIVTLANPILDMVQAFGGFTRLGMQQQGEKTAGAFTMIAEVIRRVAEAFKNFAHGPGVQYVTKVMVPILTRMINRFILLGRAISSAFRGDGLNAAKNMKALFISIAYEGLAVVKKIMTTIANLLVSNSATIGKFVGVIVDSTLKMFFAIASKLRELVIFVGSVLVGMGLAAGVVFAPAGIALTAMGSSLLAFGATTFVAEKAFNKFGAGIKKGVTDISTNVVKGIGTGFGKAAALVGVAQDRINKSYEKVTGKGINLPIARLFADPNKVAKEIKETIVEAAPDAKDGGEALGSQIAKGIKNKLLELKSSWTEKFFGNIDQEFDKIAGKIKKQLEKQKDDALDGYDDMIAGIDALAEAEEKLTRKIDYEEKRREMIRDRSVDAENYIRERKLAIYEGRYEDARKMDGEERKAKLSAAKELKDLDQGFNRDLQAEQRDIAKAIIENEKKVVEEKFNLLMENFDDQVDILKKTGFSTQDEFKKALESLGTLGTTFHDKITKTWSESMNGLPAAISSMRDTAIPLFDTEMSTLVDIAAKKFGATANVKDPSSILGAAYFMANGMSGAFKTAFDSSLITQYMQPTMTALTDLSKKTLSATDPEGFVSLWKKAGNLAVLEMINELKRSIVGLKGELYAEFAKLFEDLFKELESLATIEATLKIIRENETGGGAGAGAGAKKPKPEEESLRTGVPEGFTTADNWVREQESKNIPFTAPDLNPLKITGGLLKNIWDGMSNIGKAITGFIGAIGGVLLAVGIFRNLLVVVEAVKFAFFAIQYALYAAFGAAAGTIAAVVLAIGAVIGALVWAYFRFEKFRNLVNDSASAIWNSIVDVWDSAFAAVSNFVSGAINSIKGFWNLIRGISMDTIGKIVSFFVDGFNALKDNVGGFIGSFINVFKVFLSAIWDGIKTIVAPIIELVKKIITVIAVPFGAIVALVGAFVVVIVNIFDKIKGPLFSIIGFIIDIFAKMFDFLAPVLKVGIGIIAKSIALPFEILNTIINIAVGVIKGAIGIIVGIFKLVFDVFKAIASNPIVIFFAKLVALVGLVAAMVATWTIKIVLESIWAVLKKVIGTFVDLAQFIGGGLSNAFNAIKDLAIKVWGAIYMKIKSFIDWWHEDIGSLWLIFVAVFVIIYKAVGLFLSYMKDKFGPLLSKVWDGFKDAVGSAWDLLKKVGSWLDTVFTTVWGALKKAASAFWDFLGGAVGAVWDKIKAGWNAIGPMLKEFGDFVGSVLGDAWDFLKESINAVWNIFKAGWNFISPILKDFIDILKDGLLFYWDLLKGGINVVWDKIKAGWNFISPILKDFIGILKDGLLFYWDLLKGGINAVWDKIKEGWNFISPILKEFGDFVGSVLGGAWSFLKESISFVWDAIKIGWNFIFPILKDFVSNLKDGLLFYWDLLKGGINVVWDAIKLGWNFIFPILKDFVSNLKDGLLFYWDLLKGGINAVWDAIKAGWNFISPILKEFGDAIRDFLGGMINFVKDLWDKFVDTIVVAKDKVIGIFKAIGGWIEESIGKVISKVITVWNGLTAAFQSVWDNVKPIISFIGDAIETVIGGAINLITGAIKLLPETFKLVVNSVSGLFNKLVGGLGDFGFPKTILGWPLPFGLGGKKVSDFITLPKLPQMYNGGKVGGYMMGGMTYAAGGMTKGPVQQGIPAILHGGEYVINHKAVQRIGTDTLNRINSMKLSKPNFPKMPSVPSVNMPNMRVMNNSYSQQPRQSSSTENINIYVDNFIGESDWFNSMMSEYNVKVLPRKQKAAGLESRVISTYNGLNRGN